MSFMNYTKYFVLSENVIVGYLITVERNGLLVPIFFSGTDEINPETGQMIGDTVYENKGKVFMWTAICCPITHFLRGNHEIIHNNRRYILVDFLGRIKSVDITIYNDGYVSFDVTFEYEKPRKEVTA